MQAKIPCDAEGKKTGIAGVFKAFMETHGGKVLETLGYRSTKDLETKPKKEYKRSNRLRMKIDVIKPYKLLEATEKW